MSKTEIRLKKSASAGLMSDYHSLLEKARRELSKIEPGLVVDMLIYQTKHPDTTPWVRLEITFNPSIELAAKKEEIFEKTERAAEIRHGNVFVIDPYLTLQGLEELARDESVQYIEGTILHS